MFGDNTGLQLKELVVLELASVLAGPAVGQFFAELGATVIKVENPHNGGDVTRSWKLPSEKRENPAYFSAVNAGKRSIGLDYNSEDDLAIVHRLLEKADIVLLNLRKGQAEKWGLSCDQLLESYPNLLIGQIMGYSVDDNRPAYDAVIQAESGFMYLNGEKDGDPLKMPVALIDLLAGHELKQGLLVKLLQQNPNDRLVQVSLFQSAISSLANQASNWLNAGFDPQPMGTEHPNIMPYGTIVEFADGNQILLAVSNQKQFSALCNFLKWREGSTRFPSNEERVKRREELRTELNHRFNQLNFTASIDKMHELEIPFGRIKAVSEALEDPLAQKLIMESTTHRMLKTVSWHETEELSAPPLLDQDRNWVLDFIGAEEEKQ